VSGKALRVFRGDWHRHTDISMDGAGDGSLEHLSGADIALGDQAGKRGRVVSAAE